MDGTGGAEGAQAPPSFLDLYSKNFKISQIRVENFFFYLVVPPHKKFASVHPDCKTMIMSHDYFGKVSQIFTYVDQGMKKALKFFLGVDFILVMCKFPDSINRFTT